MSKVRVLRVMEYEYADAETAARDQANWKVQGTYTPNNLTVIRSTVLPLTFEPDE